MVVVIRVRRFDSPPIHRDPCKTTSFRRKPESRGVGQTGTRLPMCRPNALAGSFAGVSAYEAGHLPGATNLPHAKIVERNLAHWDEDTLFVVYCAGPHCNGANKAAVRLAKLGRPVKEMIGGMTGWAYEGFSVVTRVEPGDTRTSEAP